MFGLSISTVIGAHSAVTLDALFSFLVTSIETKGQLHSFTQRFQVFYGQYLLDNLCTCQLFFPCRSHAKLNLHLTRNLVYGKTQDKRTHSCTVIHVLEWTLYVSLLYVLYGDCYLECICLLPRDILSG